MPHSLQEIRQVRVIDREVQKAGLIGDHSLTQRKPAGLRGPNVKMAAKMAEFEMAQYPNLFIICEATSVPNLVLSSQNAQLLC